MKPIRKNLRVLRAARDLTQRDTAERASIPYTRYMDIENGYRVPNARELARIARVLKTTSEAIVVDPDRSLVRTADHAETNPQN